MHEFALISEQGMKQQEEMKGALGTQGREASVCLKVSLR